MDIKALVGLVWIVAVIGNGLIFVRRQRRSGQVRSNGHPIKDNVLLLASGIVLAGTMLAAFWLLEPLTHDPEFDRYILLLPFIAIAAGITWLANYVLHR